jgi:hypothetical protein
MMDGLRGVSKALLARDIDAGQELLKLLENPFVGQQLQQTSVYTSLGTSVGITAGIALLFSFLRPYNQGVYAPKLKHADEKHAPPPIVGKKPWSWITPLWRTGEHELMMHVGMDATIFLRFARMCRNMFLVLSLVGCCILIPTHLTQNVDTSGDGAEEQRWLARMTPANVWNQAMWAQVIFAWLADIIIAGFLWWNYRKVCALRRSYFGSREYLESLHARTLMVSQPISGNPYVCPLLTISRSPTFQKTRRRTKASLPSLTRSCQARPLPAPPLRATSRTCPI